MEQRTGRRNTAGNEREERKMDERVKQRILSRQKAVRPVIKEERPWRNADGMQTVKKKKPF